MEYFNISDDESLWKDGTHTDTGTEPQGNKRFGDARFTCLAAQQTYERTNERTEEKNIYPPFSFVTRNFPLHSILQTVPETEKSLFCVTSISATYS